MGTPTDNLRKTKGNPRKDDAKPWEEQGKPWDKPTEHLGKKQHEPLGNQCVTLGKPRKIVEHLDGIP